MEGKEVNYILYTIDYCPHCIEAFELMNNYCADTGVQYDIVKAETVIEKVPEKEGLLKKSFVVYSEDKKEKFELPAVPALWIKDRNELVLGSKAVDYLKEVSING